MWLGFPLLGSKEDVIMAKYLDQALPLTLAALVVPHTVPVTVGPGPRAQEAEEKQNSHTSL